MVPIILLKWANPGLPFGHVATHVTMPVGVKATLAVDGRTALIGW